jgi:hypothetical protein
MVDFGFGWFGFFCEIYSIICLRSSVVESHTSVINLRARAHSRYQKNEAQLYCRRPNMVIPYLDADSKKPKSYTGSCFS